MIHSISNTIRTGKPLHEAKKVLILIHGRGDSARGILQLQDFLDLSGFAVIAPEATGNAWYPYSFLAPPSQNEPHLSSALKLLGDLTQELQGKGFGMEQVYLMGFSQGACLCSEFAARNAQRFGGVLVLSGGVIGDKVERNRYSGTFDDTPVFLGCSDIDPHIPLHRVDDTATLFEEMGAAVTKKIYRKMGHTINDDELQQVNAILQ